MQSKKPWTFRSILTIKEWKNDSSRERVQNVYWETRHG